ncbi:Hepatocyte growth factor activator [Armadillidium nasatum]|uniref:CLIP domain-containing serine protease n=1 Tax=Armadillidium nasatum TaxID=96803 RepID=A0A5N5SQK3_9CRUS|nr:Hepatocyte growth factor activator [Armadillidium nasatum]
MYFKSARVLSGILFLMVCNAQRLGNCNTGSQCKALETCPQMLDLIKSGNPANIQTVRKSICGFVGRKTKVCCPSKLTGDNPSNPTRDDSKTGEGLLPTKCGRPVADDKIIYGTPSPMGAYPWIAALGYTEHGSGKLAFECAGAIINSKYVSVIHLGDYDLATDRDCEKTGLGLKCFNPHIVAGVEDTISHPKYDTRGRASDDIALIRLNLTLDFDSRLATIEPVCLPPKGFNFKEFAGDREPVAAGWGWTEDDKASNILLRANVPIADDALCKQRYKKNFVGNQLCIGGTKYDTCMGDSGGPLVMSEENGPPFYQVGIVSFGFFPCGQNRFPGIYTNVADYRDWIINNIKP